MVERGCVAKGGMHGKGSVHGKGGMCGEGAHMVWERVVGGCMAGGTCVEKGGVPGKGGVHGSGVCMSEGVHGRGRVWQGGMYGRRDGHCSRRYASYRNAFLLYHFPVFLLMFS